MLFLGDFLPQFQSFHIEILKSISGASNDFDQNAAKSEKVEFLGHLAIRVQVFS